MSRNVDVAQTRRESGYVDVMTGKRLDGRVKVPVDKRRQQTDSRNGQRRADGDASHSGLQKGSSSAS